MNRISSRGQNGFTLIEMLVSIGMIVIVLSMAGMAYAEIFRLRGAQERYNQRRDAADFLLRRIAADVRAGKGLALDGAELRIQTVEGTVSYAQTDQGVMRIEQRGDRTDRALVIRERALKLSFAGDAAEARSVVATLSWKEPPVIGVSQPSLSLRAALRNR